MTSKANNERVKTLPVTHVAPAKDNVHVRERRDSDTMKGLVESVKANGILHRILVRPDPEAERFVIVDGHRRFAAAKLAGMKEVPVEVVDVDERDALVLTVTANVQRLENDPLLEADAIDKMAKSGRTRREIAAAIGKGEDYVARRARLVTLVPAWREFALRVPCTVDLLERVAAHEPQLQEKVAAEVGLGDYDADSQPVLGWDEFADAFDGAKRDLADAAFDTKECAKCPNNTACHQFLFPELDDGKAVCQDAACFARRHNEVIDGIVARIRLRGGDAIEVADRWRVPEYYNASERQNKKHPQAYIWTEGGLKHIAWSVPPPKPIKPVALTAEEKAARKAEKRRIQLVDSARNKLRKALEHERGSRKIALLDADAKGLATLAERWLWRSLDKYWIDADLLDDIVSVYSDGIAQEGVLDASEIEAYKETIAPKKPNTEAGEAESGDSGEGGAA